MPFHKTKLGRWLVFFLFGLPIIPVLILAKDFIYLRGARYSDLAITHYPNAIYLLENLRRGCLPLWSNTILSGYPFAANPLSGLWYPPGWLAFLFPLPLGFNLVIAAHLVWAGLGVYTLLSSEGKNRQSAILGGLVFASLPKLLAHTGAGHLTLVYAVCWTPWLLWATMREFKRSGKHRFGWLPGVIFALVILADVRWAFYAGLLWSAYVIRLTISLSRLRDGFKRHWKEIGQGGVHLAVNSALAVGTSGIFLIPFYELIRQSSRLALEASDVLALSLPPVNMLGLIFPNFGAGAEWTLYLGAIFTLVLLALFSRPGKKRPWFWGIVWLISLTFSLGDVIPGMTGLSQLPGYNMLRVPARSLFINGLAGSILLAEYFHWMSQGEKLPRVKVFNLTLVGLTLLVVLLSGGMWLINGVMEVKITWTAIVLCGFLFLTIFTYYGKIPRSTYLLAVGGLLIMDLLGVNWMSLEGRVKDDILDEGRGTAELLSENLDIYRVYSPSYSIPQQTAVMYGLQLADGVDPLSLRNYRNFMKTATGVFKDGYSVTIPSFKTGSPDTDNVNNIPDLRLLGWLNVRYISAEFDILAEGLTLIQQTGQTRVYRNLNERPRAWVQSGTRIFENYQLAKIMDYGPNRIEISAGGPGILVLSEMSYPGWTVAINGKPENILTIEGLLRGVALGQGTQRITFSFVPMSLYIGASISVLTICVVILLGIWRSKHAE